MSDVNDDAAQLRGQLRNAESRLADAQRIARLGYWEHDFRSNRGWWSDELCRIYGVAPGRHDLRYEDFIERVHPEDRNTLKSAFQNCVQHCGPCEVQYRIVRPDGTQRIIDSKAEIELDSAGNPVSAAGTAQDVTEFKDLEQELSESEAKWRSIFEHAPVGIAVIGPDTDYRVVLANPALTRMLGYSAEELTMTSPIEFTHPDDKDLSERLVERMRRGEMDSFTTEKRYLRKDGGLLWAKAIGTVVRDGKGNVKHHVSIIEDITERKEAELRQAQAQRQQREALVREVHHRIKNTLQGVVGLLDRHAAANPGLAPAMGEATMQLNTLAMLHGLSGDAQGHEVNLCNIVQGIVEAVKLLTTVPLEFKIPFGFYPAKLAVEETVAVAMVLNELVSNATKHMDAQAAGSKITIALARTARSVRVVVRNEPATLPAGFEFVSGRMLGTGLRLVKSLMPTHGAKLRVSQSRNGVVEAVLELSPPILILVE